MNKLIAMGILLSLTGYASAGTFSISCQNAVATKEDGSTYIVEHASLSSTDEKSVFKVDERQDDLPPVKKYLGGYITGGKDINGAKLIVTAREGLTPHTSALIVSVEDENGNAMWGLLAGGCASHKTK